MKKFNAEKIIFDKFLQGFDLHIAWGILSRACSQFLVFAAKRGKKSPSSIEKFHHEISSFSRFFSLFLREMDNLPFSFFSQKRKIWGVFFTLTSTEVCCI